MSREDLNPTKEIKWRVALSRKVRRSRKTIGKAIMKDLVVNGSSNDYRCDE